LAISVFLAIGWNAVPILMLFAVLFLLFGWFSLMFGWVLSRKPHSDGAPSGSKR